MEAFFNSIRPEDEAELQEAVTEDFARIHNDIEEAKILKQRIEVRKILSETLPFISVSEFAKTYLESRLHGCISALTGTKCMAKRPHSLPMNYINWLMP